MISSFFINLTFLGQPIPKWGRSKQFFGVIIISTTMRTWQEVQIRQTHWNFTVKLEVSEKDLLTLVPQCGNFMIFLSLRFYVKLNCEKWQFQNFQNFQKLISHKILMTENPKISKLWVLNCKNLEFLTSVKLRYVGGFFHATFFSKVKDYH